MKAYMIRVEYGKNGNYVGANWVAENAVDTYKNEWTNKIRGWGWKKEINFRMNKYAVEEIAENGNGGILCYTENGLENVRVK